MLGSLEDTLQMSMAIPGVLPCLDFAHLHARKGDGSLNTEAEWENILIIYKQYLGDSSLQNLHIHLSGIEYGEKGEKEHLPVQESDLNISSIFEVLKSMNCSGRILCESPLLEEDALFMKNMFYG
jgi:deoxyribonuclease-4